MLLLFPTDASADNSVITSRGLPLFPHPYHLCSFFTISLNHAFDCALDRVHVLLSHVLVLQPNLPGLHSHDITSTSSLLSITSLHLPSTSSACPSICPVPSYPSHIRVLPSHVYIILHIIDLIDQVRGIIYASPPTTSFASTISHLTGPMAHRLLIVA